MIASRLSITSLDYEQGKSPRLPLSQRIYYGVGHVLNDLCANCWFSYTLVYMSKVAGVSETTAGLIMLIGQVADAVSTLFVGYGCDRTDISWYGKRKFWHGIGTLCVLLSFPFIFNLCVSCNDASEVTKLLYYSAFVVVFQFGWAATQIGHLALIPDIAKKESQRVELNSIRSGLTFVCGIFVYGVAWFLLGTTDEQEISNLVSKQFMILSLIIIGVGFLFSLLFHIGTKEAKGQKRVRFAPKNAKKKQKQNCCSSIPLYFDDSDDETVFGSDERIDTIATVQSDKIAEELQKSKSEKTWKKWLVDSRLYKNGLLYMCTRLTVNIFQLNFPYYLTDALHFNKEAIAYFPLIILISGSFTSSFMKLFTKKIGGQLAFVVGSVLVVTATIWLFVAGKEHRNTVYGAAWLAGSGCSVILVTSLVKTAELIGKDKSSSAFIYSTMSFTDKLSTGIAIFVIQTFRPIRSTDSQGKPCTDCELYSTIIQTSVPGICAFIGLLTVVFFFPSDFRCIRKGKSNRNKSTQITSAEEQFDTGNFKDEEKLLLSKTTAKFTVNTELASINSSRPASCAVHSHTCGVTMRNVCTCAATHASYGNQCSCVSCNHSCAPHMSAISCAPHINAISCAPHGNMFACNSHHGNVYVCGTANQHVYYPGNTVLKDKMDTISLNSYVDIDAEAYLGMAISYPDLKASSLTNLSLLKM